MKHIIFVMPTLRMGGAEKALVSLLKSLDPKRVAVDLFLFETGGVLEKEVPSWVNIIEGDPIVRDMTLEMRNYFGELIRQRKFSAALARLKITLQARQGKHSFSWDTIKKFIPSVEGHYDVAIGFLEGFADFFVIDKINADKKIGWIHIDMTGRNFSPQECEYYKKFDIIATISAICKKAFTEIMPELKDKIQILENIVSSNDIISKSEAKTNTFWELSKLHLVSVGRLDYQKGFDIGAKAAKVLKEQGYDFCWHVYGIGIMKKEIEQYVAENQLGKYYILEGLCENPYPYMKRADIIVQPSRWEGKSLVLDEAKILGKAIIVTNYPSVTDQVTDRKTGIIVETTPEAIAHGVELLFKDKKLLYKLEENCRRELNQSVLVVNRFYELIDV